jgi:hypothetical protein
MLFFSKGYYFQHRPNSLLLVIEPVLLLSVDICGQYGGKIGEFGLYRPEKRTWAATPSICDWRIFSTLLIGGGTSILSVPSPRL